MPPRLSIITQCGRGSVDRLVLQKGRLESATGRLHWVAVGVEMEAAEGYNRATQIILWFRTELLN